ncbi:C40 family peptidase [Marinitenerispora sediminis]|uniref:Glycoside hydrolase n=1 Tax=Marinitenerispora sediminis TaxID=1931232 RepID=A0A368SYT2_9ACTN|nr:NlpC/P60 family protein [Marinitenerispora sediminis]RCV48265.1 glycoside hydrolase [Marinitenerispora sediminis]RCV48354.1 glycoside hydrolase [Marinitenerispora sediminis]RCV49796.1 glycoside hydrolase [Marinitenerispora sediminis]
MDNRHDRGSYRRHLAAVGFIAAGALVLSPGIANAEPTPDEVRDEIEQLEREFSELNEAYNAAKQDHDAAQKKLEDIEQDLQDTEDDLESLRGSVRSLANAAYSGADYSSPAYLLSSSGPEDVLRHAADLGYLSSSQEQSLLQYSEKKDTLERLQDEAEQTEQEAQDKLDEAEEARDEGEQKMEEQQELLDSLTAEEQAEATSGVGAASHDSSSEGASYTGSASGDARTALDFAFAQVGKPYIWGGTGPDGYDCSGLTQAAWAQAGVSLPRVSQDQFNAGQRVSWDQLQPGDLMFFYDSSAPTHVGMYAGDNQMVHASTSSKPIGVVELNDYYRTNFVGGVRP